MSESYSGHGPVAEFLENTIGAEQTVGDEELAWLGSRYQGKVRDVYDRGSELVLVATDRQSAFDISWCLIPLKGQVLTQLSVWWFEQMRHVMPNHLIASPDPNVTVTKKLTMFPVEVVVRSYLTGTTETSVWVNYNRGIRDFCGNPLPSGMVKNQKLPQVIITPTTKAKEDELIDSATILSRGLVSAEHWAEICDRALALFAEGQRLAQERGLILVDTKYEFGIDSDGVLTVADEVHTPDSSRYWMLDSYERRFAAGQEPESLDKEFFRRWLVEHGFDPRLGVSSPRPEITDQVRVMLAEKYVELFQKVTGANFVFPGHESIPNRINTNLRRYFGA